MYSYRLPRMTTRSILRPPLYPGATLTPTSVPNQTSRSYGHARLAASSGRFPKGQSGKDKLYIHSNASSTVAILLAAATVSIVTYRELTCPIDKTQGPDDQLAEKDTLRKKEVAAIMAGELPPGRPDNLTAEEEVKLKEFWLALQSVCGVSPLTNGTDSTSETADTSAEIKEKDLEKIKKKKRLGLFNRNKGEDEKASVSAIEGEDKYGQGKDYMKVLESQKPEELREAVWGMVKHDNPDALLLRFLRARKWHVQNALIMMIATMHWRQQELHIDDDIVHRGELGALEDSQSSNAEKKKEGKEFLMQMRLGKSFVHGKDREGRPMCFVRVRLHHGADQSEKCIERYTVYTIETSRFLLKPPVDTAVCILDVPNRRILADLLTGNRFRYDRFFPCKHGLHAREVHDQSLRS